MLILSNSFGWALITHKAGKLLLLVQEDEGSAALLWFWTLHWQAACHHHCRSEMSVCWKCLCISGFSCLILPKLSVKKEKHIQDFFIYWIGKLFVQRYVFYYYYSSICTFLQQERDVNTEVSCSSLQVQVFKLSTKCAVKLLSQGFSINRLAVTLSCELKYWASWELQRNYAEIVILYF